jgi:hypothetical protein
MKVARTILGLKCSTVCLFRARLHLTDMDETLVTTNARAYNSEHSIGADSATRTENMCLVKCKSTRLKIRIPKMRV